MLATNTSILRSFINYRGQKFCNIGPQNKLTLLVNSVQKQLSTRLHTQKIIKVTITMPSGCVLEKRFLSD